MIGERIRELRKVKDITQQAFADSLSVKRNTVATWEGGRSIPQDSAISLICRTYDVNEAWLRTGEGEMLAAQTRNEVLADYIRDCMHKPDSFKARFAEGMAKLTDEQWEQLAQIVTTIFEQKK